MKCLMSLQLAQIKEIWKHMEHINKTFLTEDIVIL